MIEKYKQNVVCFLNKGFKSKEYIMYNYTIVRFQTLTLVLNEIAMWVMCFKNSAPHTFLFIKQNKIDIQ